MSVNKDNFVIYPSYFNSVLSRSSGRKQPLSESVKRPTSDEIEKILKSLNFNFTSKTKSRPSNPLQIEGCFLVNCDIKKSELLHLIGKELKKSRQTQ
tara:strand:- start:5683 stop:5973 length:291 start_codon:yes stop_codon:yes gene_type:complete